jgi:hypothetical protein
MTDSRDPARAGAPRTGPRSITVGTVPGWRAVTSTALLTAVVVAWSALPVRSGGWPRIALVAAILTGIMALAQLAVADLKPSQSAVASLAQRLFEQLVAAVMALPWPELLTVDVLIQEALHPAKPWHTGLLAVGLLGYLLAVHLAETKARAGVLRRQLPLIAAGFAVTALAVGAAALPVLPAGPASAVLRVVAAIAAVVAGGLAVPVWLGAPRFGR